MDAKIRRFLRLSIIKHQDYIQMVEKKFFMRKVIKSTCIAQDKGIYKLITEPSEPISVRIDLLDIQTGGLRLITEIEILSGTDFD